MTTALAAIGTATWWTFLTLGLWPSFTWSLFRKLGDDIRTTHHQQWKQAINEATTTPALTESNQS